MRRERISPNVPENEDNRRSQPRITRHGVTLDCSVLRVQTLQTTGCLLEYPEVASPPTLTCFLADWLLPLVRASVQQQGEHGLGLPRL